MTATTPPHGRTTIPVGCLCKWQLQRAVPGGQDWWQMMWRSSACELHQFREERTVVDQAMTVGEMLGRRSA